MKCCPKCQAYMFFTDFENHPLGLLLHCSICSSTHTYGFTFHYYYIYRGSVQCEIKTYSSGNVTFDEDEWNEEEKLAYLDLLRKQNKANETNLKIVNGRFYSRLRITSYGPVYDIWPIEDINEQYKITISLQT